MKKNYESVYRMKLTGYQVRTAIGILNERRLALKSQGCTLENSEEYVGVYSFFYFRKIRKEQKDAVLDDI